MKRDKITVILIITLVGMCILAGCESLKNVTLNDISNKVYPVSCIAMNEEQAKKIQGKMPIHLYYADNQNKLKMVIRYIDITSNKGDINNVATIIIEELMKKPQEGGLRTVIPNGTKLKMPVEVKNNVAYVNFSEEFINNHKGGKIEEQLTIFSIVNSLTELKDIHRVRFKINGKTLKEYKGNFKFDRDFPKGVSKISNIQM